MTTTPLNLIGLRLYDYGRIEAIELSFDPAGGVFAVQGQNGAGKSTVLDGLESLIAGRKAPRKDEPVRLGQDSARVVADFGDIVVTRTWKRNAATGKTATSIKVTNPEGVQVASADEIMGRLYSSFAVDPAAFAAADAREQIDALVQLLGFDPAPIDARIEEAKARRIVIGRDRDRLKGVLDSTPVVPNSTPDEEVSASGTVAERDELAREINDYAQRGEQVRRLREETIPAREDNVQRAEAAVIAAQRSLHEAEEAVQRIRDEAQHLANTVDRMGVLMEEKVNRHTELGVMLDNLDATNAAVRTKRQRAEAKAAHEAAAAAYKEQTDAIAAAEREKADAFAAANDRLPIAGVAIENGNVTLNGVPVSQISTGEADELGFAVAVASNPTLRAVIVRNGSNLDASRISRIDALAREHGLTTLVELVGDSAPFPGVVIVDGMVEDVRS